MALTLCPVGKSARSAALSTRQPDVADGHCNTLQCSVVTTVLAFVAERGASSVEGDTPDASFWLQVTAHRFGSGPGAHHDQTGFCSSCVTGISRTGLCYGTGSMPEVRLCTTLTGVSGDSCARCLKNKLQFIGQLT